MPSKRIIASLIVRDGWVVQSIGFTKYLPVGRAEIAAKFLDDWGVDEIVLLDITATRDGRVIDADLVRRVSNSCFVPVTVGGGIKSVEDIRTLLHAGADKICLNSTALTAPDLIGKAAHHFGQQCVMVSVDAVTAGPATYRVYDHVNAKPTNVNPAQFSQTCANAGAGEILLNAVHRDGAKSGYDLILAHQVSSAVTVPVIVCGGAGDWWHIQQVLEIDDVAAAAAANFFALHRTHCRDCERHVG